MYPSPSFVDWQESWTGTADLGWGWGLCSQDASVWGALIAKCGAENKCKQYIGNTNRFQVQVEEKK